MRLWTGVRRLIIASMATPLVLSTWTFGSIASGAAWPVLERGGSSLDAVVEGCRAVEDDPSVDSVGYGGLPDRSGRVSLDACVMTAPSRCGSVACIRRFRNPASIARLVMERTQHVMLVGPDAEEFAQSQGMKPAELLTDSARQGYERWAREHPDAAKDPTVAWRTTANIEEQRNRDHDTVGVLALDANGRLAGACSTSGRAYKVPGRVGDSPIIGHGLYVHPDHGAAVATGTGELVMGVCGTFLAVEMMRGGASPREAAESVMRRIVESYELLPEHQVALIALAPTGEWAAAALRKGYSTAVGTRQGFQQLKPDAVLLD